MPNDMFVGYVAAGLLILITITEIIWPIISLIIESIKEKINARK